MGDTEKRRSVDLHHAPTLAVVMSASFAEQAKRYGVRLEGIEADVNEWNDFFLMVARSMLGEAPDA